MYQEPGHNAFYYMVHELNGRSWLGWIVNALERTKHMARKSQV